MNVAIPLEFEVFAREQVKAGAVSSEEEAVAVALRDYLAQVEELRALIDPAIAEQDRGEGVDGATFMRELIAESRARHGGWASYVSHSPPARI